MSVTISHGQEIYLVGDPLISVRRGRSSSYHRRLYKRRKKGKSGNGCENYQKNQQSSVGTSRFEHLPTEDYWFYQQFSHQLMLSSFPPLCFAKSFAAVAGPSVADRDKGIADQLDFLFESCERVTVIVVIVPFTQTDVLIILGLVLASWLYFLYSGR